MWKQVDVPILVFDKKKDIKLKLTQRESEKKTLILIKGAVSKEDIIIQNIIYQTLGCQKS